MTGSQSSVSASWNGFSTMVGGGLNVNVNKSLGVRLAQFDWFYYHFGSKNVGSVTAPSFSGSNNLRISTGTVFRF